jgi:hypothetical protein
MSSRPGLVTVVAVIVYLNALFTILGGVILLIGANSPEVDSAVGGAGLAVGTGVIAMLLGLLTLLVARGLFSGSNLSRGIIAGIQLFAALNGLLSIVHGQVAVGVVNLLVALVVIGILYSGRANAFFRH